MRSALCDFLGIDVPVVQAPIGSATTPELAAAVSNAGGLGSLALSWRDPREIGALLERTRQLTARPFLVNLVLAWSQHERLEACLEHGVPIVSTFWGSPAPLVDAVHRAGAILIHTVGSAPEARSAVEEGADVIVVQGIEAGGHIRGGENLRRVVPAVLDAIDPVPVLAAGGIVLPHQVAEMLELGAAGVWIGTRFLCSEEAGVDRSYQHAILQAGSGDTLLTTLFDKGWEDAPHRVLVNSTVRAWLEARRPPAGTRPGERDIVAVDPTGRPIERYSDVIPVSGLTGNLEALALYAGEGAALIDSVLPAAAIVRQLAGSCDR